LTSVHVRTLRCYASYMSTPQLTDNSYICYSSWWFPSPLLAVSNITLIVTVSSGITYLQKRKLGVQMNNRELPTCYQCVRIARLNTNVRRSVIFPGSPPPLLLLR